MKIQKPVLSLLGSSSLFIAGMAFADGIAEDTLYHGKDRTLFTLGWHTSSETINRHLRAEMQNEELMFVTYNARSPGTLPLGMPDYGAQDIWELAEHDNEIGDLVALDVHFAMGVVHTFLSEDWGYAAYDDMVLGVINKVNGCCESDHGASYNDTTNTITYWMDNEADRYSLATYIDVVAHEYFHAMEAHRNIFQQSSALASRVKTIEESLADIFSALVQDHYNDSVIHNYNGDADVWMYSRYPGIDLRAMHDPKSGIPEDPQADTFLGENWAGDHSQIDHFDDDGMYGNTGVPSHWAYLVSEGSGATDGVNDNGDEFSVTGQGISQLSQLFFKTLPLLSQQESWIELRDHTTEAAMLIEGPALEDGRLVQAVVHAWHAVGLYGPLKAPTEFRRGRYGSDFLELYWDNFVWDAKGYQGTWHETDLMGKISVERKRCMWASIGGSKQDGIYGCGVTVLESFPYLPWSETPGAEFTIVEDHQSEDTYRLVIDDYFGRQVKTDWF